MIDLTADTIDVQDITSRVEELRNDKELLLSDLEENPEGPDAVRLEEIKELEEELEPLEEILSDLCGYGGDHQYNGEWYPNILINDNYFKEYAQEFAEEIRAPNYDNDVWPYTCIDWDRAADDLKMDYSSLTFPNGETYYYLG